MGGKHQLTKIFIKEHFNKNPPLIPASGHYYGEDKERDQISSREEQVLCMQTEAPAAWVTRWARGRCSRPRTPPPPSPVLLHHQWRPLWVWPHSDTSCPRCPVYPASRERPASCPWPVVRLASLVKCPHPASSPRRLTCAV